jgi:hypothetical protein
MLETTFWFHLFQGVINWQAVVKEEFSDSVEFHALVRVSLYISVIK